MTLLARYYRMYNSWNHMFYIEIGWSWLVLLFQLKSCIKIIWRSWTFSQEMFNVNKNIVCIKLNETISINLYYFRLSSECVHRVAMCPGTCGIAFPRYHSVYYKQSQVQRNYTYTLIFGGNLNMTISIIEAIQRLYLKCSSLKLSL